jgi:hypothetical protein
MTEKLQPTSLTVEHTARLLSAAGGRPVTEEMIRKDIEAGAPVNADGTINLIHYAAWSVKERVRAD